MTSSTLAASSALGTRPRPRPRSSAVVAAGLALGWLGSDSGVSGTDVAVDLALAWTFVGASLVALERARWRRSRILLVAAALALLAEDLRWAKLRCPVDARLPARQLSGGTPRPVRADVPGRTSVVAIGACRHRRRIRGDARRSADRGACSTSGSRTCSQRDQERASPTPSIGRRRSSACPRSGRRSAGRATTAAPARSGPTRASATARCRRSVASLRPLPGSSSALRSPARAATLETIARASALLVPSEWRRALSGRGSSRSDASDLVVELKTEGAASLRERLARVLGDPTLEVAYRLDDGRYVDAAGRPVELPQDPRPRGHGA